MRINVFPAGRAPRLFSFARRRRPDGKRYLKAPDGKDIAVKSFAALFFAISLIVLAGGCASTDDVVPPRVNLVNIVPARSSGVFEQRFLVDLRITNPNDFDIPINGLSFEMDVNGDYFAIGVSNQKVVVPRLGTALVSVDTTANSFELFRQILNIVRTGTVDYSIKGSAIVSGLGTRTVPFYQEGDLNLVPDPVGRDRLAPTKTGASR
jgi:LEA14-like dessication related protein